MRNIDKYKNDLNSLIKLGDKLYISIFSECNPKVLENECDEIKIKIPKFKEEYQLWYTEAILLIKQLIPDRLGDFIKLYEKPKVRKNIDHDNYVIEDYLHGLMVKNGRGDIIVGPYSAIAKFEQQLNILKSIVRRFESSLFDIEQLVQADLFDSELGAAKELNKKKFTRGAGAIAGVVLEKHLSMVVKNHNLKIQKKNSSISDLNDLLKNNNIYEIPTWRKIQHLGDIRNLCDHNKNNEPKFEEVDELILGVDIIIKTVF